MFALLTARVYTALWLGVMAPRRRRPDSERGDVPGWVLITVMTAGLVLLIWGVAGPELEKMLKSALQKVSSKT